MKLKLLTTRLSYALFCMLLSYAVSAQTKTVSGKVTSDKDGSPISGASVVAKGTSKGTQTNAAGTYTIEVAAGVNKLVISSVGFGTSEVSVNGANTDVALKASGEGLNEVVVIGYGTRKVKDLTGSVATITSKDFNKGVISSPQDLFQGRTPGVTVTPASGEPGAGVTVNIRGTGSIYNSDPLYVVDGVPLNGGGSTATGATNSSTSNGLEGSTTPKNPLIFLNPNDIESITILKDASSTAIYGSAGANGVVIITTKSGKGKKGSFQFGTSVSISKTAKRYDLLNSQDFLVGVKKANIDAGTSPADAATAVLNVDKGYNTNWQDEIFQTGVTQNYNLAWGFANNGTSLRLSGSYDDQKGIVKNSSLKRSTVRANFSQKLLADKLKLDANLSYSNVKNQYAPNSDNAGYQGSLIGATITFNPTYPIFNTDGTYFDPKDGNRNPAEVLAYFDDRDRTNRALANLSASYKILDGLVFKSTLGFDGSNTLRKSFADPRLSSNAFAGSNNFGSIDLKNGIQGNGRALYQNKKYNSTLIEHLLTYDKTFKNGHELNAFVGFHYQKVSVTNDNQLRWGQATPVIAAGDVFVKDINNFTSPIVKFGDPEDNTEQSYFVKANYIIGSKYYFTGSIRRDGDSRFGINNKYGNFPSASVKWRITKENFAKDNIAKVFDDLSVRLNYGIVGSKGSVPYYGSLAVRQKYDFSTLGLPSGVTVTSDQTLTNASPSLKWESTTNKGIGIDFALLKNKLKGSLDFYNKSTKDLILYDNTPPRSQAAFIWRNLDGVSVTNKGYELSLTYQAIQIKNFSWEIMFNTSKNDNKVKSIRPAIITGQVNGQGLSGAYAQQIIDGYPLFTFNMPVYLGLDGNGDARYANGVKDALLGSPLPTNNYSLSNNFTFGKWNASIFVNGSTGFYVYNNTGNALLLKGSLKTAHNVTYAVANSPEDPINPGSVSSRFLEKGDFARLSNASLGYTFNLKKTSVVKTLNFSLSGQNLILITNYSGLDPEVNVNHPIGNNPTPSRGFDYVGYPKARTFTLGLNMGF